MQKNSFHINLFEGVTAEFNTVVYDKVTNNTEIENCNFRIEQLISVPVTRFITPGVIFVYCLPVVLFYCSLSKRFFSFLKYVAVKKQRPQKGDVAEERYLLCID